jgi:hypothetical protein
MKTTKKILFSEEKEVLDELFCNKCGKNIEYAQELTSGDGDSTTIFGNGICEYTYIPGFNSKIFKEGSRLTFSLCEYCLDIFCGEFKIKVDLKNIFDFNKPVIDIDPTKSIKLKFVDNSLLPKKKKNNKKQKKSSKKKKK